VGAAEHRGLCRPVGPEALGPVLGGHQAGGAMGVHPVLLGVVAPVFDCEPVMCAFQLNQEVCELRVLRAPLSLVVRAVEAGDALARPAPLVLTPEL
jgi:hypothetical protein